eukprot:5008205-Pleurochrysis_carterae.AAC.1
MRPNVTWTFTSPRWRRRRRLEDAYRAASTHWMTRAVPGRRRSRRMLVIEGCEICVSSRKGNAISSISCRLSSR